jgi:hypothetical protein
MAATDRTVTTVRPVHGVRRFRERCRLGVHSGALVATDGRGQDHRYPLDGSEAAPSEFLDHAGWWSIVDRRGEALVRGSHDDWDSAEIEDLTKQVGITSRWDRDDALPDLRDDGVVLEQSFVARWAVPIVGCGSGTALAVAYLAPVWLAVAYFTVLLGLALYAWRAGALVPPRRSKSTPMIEAMAAKAEKERLEQYGPVWEPPVRGRWRLAVEWQFGIFFATAIVTALHGAYGPAAVLPLISALFFFFTRYVFPGVSWYWWALVVMSNITGWAMFLAELSAE